MSSRRCSSGRLAAALAAVAALAGGAEAQIYTRVRGGIVEATNIPHASDFRLAYPGKGTLIHSFRFRGSYSGEYDPLVEQAASAHGVSSALVRAVIQVESEFDRLAVSSKGARGLMQLMPDTARRFGVSDAFDARQNVLGGVQYLRLLLDLFRSDVDLALAAYNAGENAVLRFGGIPPFKETQAYVRKVRSLLGDLPRPVAASYAPRALRAPAGGTPKRAAPAPPRAYYRYRDERGVLHVAQEPPSEGVAYTLIRAFEP